MAFSSVKHTYVLRLVPAQMLSLWLRMLSEHMLIGTAALLL